MPPHRPDPAPVLRLHSASLRYGERVLWSHLDLEVAPGEFLAVLGSNGTGKTSLLRALLGQVPLSAGTAELLGRPVRRGDRRIGYVPQQKLMEQGTPLRARDLVALGLDGHRYGLPFSSAATRRRVDEVLVSVGAEHLADAPVATLSGGEQQRIRIGQAVAGRARVLLCDEPLLSLDLGSQRALSELIDTTRRDLGTAVVFVTHDVNPILPMVDRVLYLAHGRFRVGTPDEVLRSEVLTDLYGTPVDVIRRGDRLAVLGAPDGRGAHGHDPHHPEEVGA